MFDEQTCPKIKEREISILFCLTYPNLIYLTIWASIKNLKELEKKFNNNQIRLGRGLIFHICPSNVPTNFIYSFSNFTTPVALAPPQNTGQLVVLLPAQRLSVCV